MAQSALVIVGGWQRKSLEASSQSNDGLIVAVNKGFDAMAAVLKKDSNPEASRFFFDDSLRELVYGLLESMHVSLNEWNEERNQRKKTGEFSTQTEEEFTISFIGPITPSHDTSLRMYNHALHNQPNIPDSSPTIPIEPKEEPIDIHLPQDYQISDSELMREENLFKEEDMDNENNELIADNSDPILSDSLNILEQSTEDPTDFSQVLPRDIRASSLIAQDEMDFNEEEAPNDDMGQPSDFMDFPMDFNDEITGHRDLPLTENNDVSLNSIKEVDESAPPEHLGEEELTNDLINNEGGEEEDAIVNPTNIPKDTSDSVKVDKRRRSSRKVSKPVQYNESMEDSDGDGGPFTKKSRSDSMKKDDKERRSFKGNDQSDDVTKRVRVSKKNDTELECPECEFRSLSAPSWVEHLRKIHSTTPALAGLALLCECGYEARSGEHSRACAYNATVIRKSEGPQCVQCVMHPKTAIGYVCHLHHHHNSTLAQAYCCDGHIGVSISFQNGIYLKCSCGLELRSSNDYKHFSECNPRQFTLHKLVD